MKMFTLLLVVVTLTLTGSCFGYELEEEAEIITNHSQELSENKKFELYTSLRVSWEKAFEECKARNMTLASIMNEVEQSTLKSTIIKNRPYSAFWISGSAGRGETFYWNSTGTPMKFTDWSKDEPNVFRDYRCVLVNNRGDAKWMIYKCQEEEFFICEHY